MTIFVWLKLVFLHILSKYFYISVHKDKYFYVKNYWLAVTSLISWKAFLQYLLSSVIPNDKSLARLITFLLMLLYAFLLAFLNTSFSLLFCYFTVTCLGIDFLLIILTRNWWTPRSVIFFKISGKYSAVISLYVALSPFLLVLFFRTCLDIYQTFSPFLPHDVIPFYVSGQK